MDIFEHIRQTFGSYSECARQVGARSPQVVSAWKIRGRVPQQWVRPLFNAANGEIPLHVIRPDLYTAPELPSAETRATP